jgi:Mg2+/Co2+ transporter CorB
MTAEEHNKTLATLHLIYGAMHGLTLLGLLLLVFVVKFASPAGELISGVWMAMGALIFVILLLAVGLLPLLVGFALTKRRKWARPLGLALAVISLINIPIGTALGIYTIKFLRSEGGIKIYGGKPSATGESELQDALRGAQPLMNLADRLK